MVILSVGILSRPKGQVLLSRQFTSMTHSYIEGIWSLFPSLLKSQGHTYTNYVEDKRHHLRYVYQILDELYIVVLTNYLSNIIRDRQFASRLSRIISDTCGSMTIEHVKLHTFDILMCLDELVNQAGYEDEGSIEKQLLMESIEENKEESDRKMKEKNVKKIMFEKAHHFAYLKTEARRTGKRFELDSQSDFHSK